MLFRVPLGKERSRALMRKKSHRESGKFGIGNQIGLKWVETNKCNNVRRKDSVYQKIACCA